MNVDGQLRSLVYGRPVAVHTDPIEKKPFYHFLPGSPAFSFATTGCPLACKFCQNWEISQAAPDDFATRFAPPAAMVRLAKDRAAPVIAFTYNEPTVFMEYMADVARLARKQRIRSVLVSCGFMNAAPLDELCRVLDAIKIDLKGFSPAFYRDVCNAELAPVLATIKRIARSGVHLEIVNLVVPTPQRLGPHDPRPCRLDHGRDRGPTSPSTSPGSTPTTSSSTSPRRPSPSSNGPEKRQRPAASGTPTWGTCPTIRATTPIALPAKKW